LCWDWCCCHGDIGRKTKRERGIVVLRVLRSRNVNKVRDLIEKEARAQKLEAKEETWEDVDFASPF
jgi:hypothetical protein